MLYYDTMKDRYVRHAFAPERTKALIFVFVFVLVHEQAISINTTLFLQVFIVSLLLITFKAQCKLHNVKAQCKLHDVNHWVFNTVWVGYILQHCFGA